MPGNSPVLTDATWSNP